MAAAPPFPAVRNFSRREYEKMIDVGIVRARLETLVQGIELACRLFALSSDE